MDTILQSVFVRMYALQFAQICKDVLAELSGEVSTYAELRYVNVLAPKINEAYAEYYANQDKNLVTTSAGKLALAEARALEKEAEELLTEDNVAEERKLFLRALATTYVNLSYPLPNKAEYVGDHLVQIYKSGFITPLKKEAKKLNMDNEVIKLLSDIERLSKHLYFAQKASK